jgi:beta-ketodecanoyl-[acyl-carrier-protein] synthase
MRTTVLSGSGIYVPSDTISNQEIVDSFNQYAHHYNVLHAEEISSGQMKPLQESSASFISKASGIENRHVIEKTGILDPKRLMPHIAARAEDELSVQAEFAVHAAKQAMQIANKTANDIQAVIASASIFQRSYPAIAIEVQHALGIKGYAFDMNVACSSGTFAIQTAVSHILNGMANCVLVVTPEINSGHVNFRDRDSHFIFSDAASAVIIELQQDCTANDAFAILGCKLLTQFSNNVRNDFGFLNRCEEITSDGIVPSGRLFRQKGRRVFKDVVPLAVNAITEHLAEHNLNPEQLTRLWLHQANQNMDRLIAEKVFGHALDHNKVPMVLTEYANTAAAGSVIAFHNHHQDLQIGDYGIICSFGAGYSVGNILVQKVI